MRRSIRPSILPAALRALAVGTSLALVLGCTSLEGARLYARGTDALERGDGAEAVVELERAAELLPEASPVQNHLGLAYVQVGRDAEARAAFQRAVDLDCSNQAAQHNLRAAKAGHLRPPEASDVP